MAFIILGLMAALVSCQPKLGWGVVLWKPADLTLPAGTIVPVYYKSSLQNQYIIGMPSTGKKAELPQWQLRFFATRSLAQAYVASAAQYLTLYMIAQRDGVPVRESPDSNSNRVYRLKEGEVVKILGEAKGSEVIGADGPINGQWYKVLAADGSEGFAFSFAFAVIDEQKGPIQGATQVQNAAAIDTLFSKGWRPAYFQEMVEVSRINLDYFSMRYGLFADSVRKQVRIELPRVSRVFNYESIENRDGIFFFVGSPLRMRLSPSDILHCAWTDSAYPLLIPIQPDFAQAAPEAEAAPSAAAASATTAADTAQAPPATQAPQAAPSPASSDDTQNSFDTPSATSALPLGASSADQADASSGAANYLDSNADASMDSPSGGTPADKAAANYRLAGTNGTATFVAWTSDLAALIRKEEQSQQDLLTSFVQKAGANWQSSQSGELHIRANRTFDWTGHPDLGEAARSSTTGYIAFRLYLTPHLRSNWDGAFSLQFAPAKNEKKPRPWLDFLYRNTPDGLILALAEGDRINATEPQSIDTTIPSLHFVAAPNG